MESRCHSSVNSTPLTWLWNGRAKRRMSYENLGRSKVNCCSLKYGMSGGDGSEPLYRARPTRVFGLIEKSFPKRLPAGRSIDPVLSAVEIFSPTKRCSNQGAVGIARRRRLLRLSLVIGLCQITMNRSISSIVNANDLTGGIYAPTTCIQRARKIQPGKVRPHGEISV
jgi:hypothetical protein